MCNGKDWKLSPGSWESQGCLPSPALFSIVLGILCSAVRQKIKRYAGTHTCIGEKYILRIHSFLHDNQNFILDMFYFLF